MKRTHFHIVLFAVLLLAAQLILPGCASADEEILIGLIPDENIFRAIEKHRPLEAYLSEKLGVRVKFTLLSRYGDIVDRFMSRDMDGAFFGIYTSVLAIDKLDVEPIVRSVNLDGGTTAKGVLFSRTDSSIRNLQDMRDKRAAFVDRATATGYIFAIAYLKENGIDNIDDFFSEYTFTGSHESTIFAVLDGRADIGVAKKSVLDRLISDDAMIKDEIYIIATSADLPDKTLMVRKNINADTRNMLQEALIRLDRTPEGIQILDTLGISRFIDASDEDFSEVRSLAEKAGIGPEE